MPYTTDAAVGEAVKAAEGCEVPECSSDRGHNSAGGNVTVERSGLKMTTSEGRDGW